MGKLPNSLTIKQTKFCHYYLIPPHNAKKSAIAAGYSQHMANTIGCRLKNNPAIQTYLKALQSDLEKQMKVTYEWKLKKLERVVNEFITENKGLVPKHVSTALQAIAELNKMQGHYSAEKHVNVEVKADADFQTLDRLVNQHAKDY